MLCVFATLAFLWLFFGTGSPLTTSIGPFSRSGDLGLLLLPVGQPGCGLYLSRRVGLWCHYTVLLTLGNEQQRAHIRFEENGRNWPARLSRISLYRFSGAGDLGLLLLLAGQLGCGL